MSLDLDVFGIKSQGNRHVLTQIPIDSTYNSLDTCIAMCLGVCLDMCLGIFVSF